MRDIFLGILVLVIFHLSNIIYAQGVVVCVNNYNNGTAVPYAAVKMYKDVTGFYTNEVGQYTLKNVEVQAFFSDSIQVSALGFNDSVFVISEIEDTILLNLKPKVLIASDAIEIRAKKVKSKKYIFKNSRYRPINALELARNYASVAQYIVLPKLLFSESEYVILDEIAIHLQTLVNDSRAPFRIVLYRFNEGCACPGEPITDVPIVRKRAKSGWNNIVIPNSIILSDNKFFIAFEVLSPYFEGRFTDGHTLSYYKGYYPTFRRLNGENSWLDHRRFKNVDFLFRLKMRAMYER